MYQAESWDEATPPLCEQCGGAHCRCQNSHSTRAMRLSTPLPAAAIDRYVDELFAKADGFDFLENDYAQGVAPPVSTGEVVGEIHRRLHQQGVRNIRSDVAFGVGRRGVQAERTGQVRSRPDLQYPLPYNQRIRAYLEVDPPGRAANHSRDHLRAIRQAVLNGASINHVRSIFLTSTPQGRIREFRQVVYRRDASNRITPVMTHRQLFATPIPVPRIVSRYLMIPPPSEARISNGRR